jgi:hypothetical protein
MRLKAAAVAVVGALLAFAGVYIAGRKDGRQKAAQDAAEETVNRVEKGNEQVARNRGADPTERLRDNDRRWMR